MQDLNSLFPVGNSNITGTESTETTDATATLETTDAPEEISQLAKPEEDSSQFILGNNLSEETEEKADEPEDEKVEEPDYKALFEAKNDEFDKLTKQHRDFQSFNDSKFNELEKKFNDFKQEPAQPVEPELTEQQINDLYYENPAKAMQKVIEMQNKSAQPQQPQITPQDIQLQVQEGVQRDQHEDYDDVINNLKSVASFHPQIIEKINASNNKAKTAYEEGIKLQSANASQADPDAYRTQLREEILKELELDKNTKNRPSLRGVPSSAKSTANTAPTERPLEDLFQAGKRGKSKTA